MPAGLPDCLSGRGVYFFVCMGIGDVLCGMVRSCFLNGKEVDCAEYDEWKRSRNKPEWAATLPPPRVGLPYQPMSLRQHVSSAGNPDESEPPLPLRPTASSTTVTVDPDAAASLAGFVAGIGGVLLILCLAAVVLWIWGSINIANKVKKLNDDKQLLSLSLFKNAPVVALIGALPFGVTNLAWFCAFIWSLFPTGKGSTRTTGKTSGYRHDEH